MAMVSDVLGHELADLLWSKLLLAASTTSSWPPASAVTMVGIERKLTAQPATHGHPCRGLCWATGPSPRRSRRHCRVSEGGEYWLEGRPVSDVDPLRSVGPARSSVPDMKPSGDSSRNSLPSRRVERRSDHATTRSEEGRPSVARHRPDRIRPSGPTGRSLSGQPRLLTGPGQRAPDDYPLLRMSVCRPDRPSHGHASGLPPVRQVFAVHGCGQVQGAAATQAHIAAVCVDGSCELRRTRPGR